MKLSDAEKAISKIIQEHGDADVQVTTSNYPIPKNEGYLVQISITFATDSKVKL